MKNLILIFGFLITFQRQAVAKSSQPPVTTAASVNLHQYLGTWFEVAAIPQSFQKKCIGNTTAVYAFAEDGLISVVNSCDTASGKRSVANGRAKIVDKESNARLKVTFVNFFGWQFLLGGDYWILALGKDYSYAIVGSPDRDYAWILSRTPEFTKDQFSEANQVLVNEGYDTCQLLSSIQTSGLQQRTPLCQLVSEK